MKRTISLVVIAGLVGIMVSPMTVIASNSVTQNASTSQVSTIAIKGQDYITDVSTITFPAGAPGAVISNPGNGAASQILGGAGTAKPVVTLLNGGSGALQIWYNITTFSNSVAAGEKYVINNKGAACADVAAITQIVAFDTLTNSGVTITNGAGNEKDLYLSLTLGSVAGKSGTSTITILGETP